MNPTIRFALIGCGRISKRHIDAIGEVSGAEIVAVCDADALRVQKAAAYIGDVASFTNLHEMLTTVEVDVVSILTPSGYHADQAITVAQDFGRHVVVEKPMALRLRDADDMIRACDSAGVRLFVVKQNRYNLPVMKVRKTLEAGRFGKMVMGTVRVRWTRHQEYYDQDAWRGTWALDGGVFSNQASHHVDLLEWMLGQPVSVMAKTATRLADIEVEDTGVAIITFESGAIGVVEATTATRPNDLEGSLSLLGEHGSVVISGFAVNTMETWRFDDASEDENNRVLREFAEMPPNVYGFGHKRYYESVLESLRSGGPALVDGLEGRKSLELINAIYESVETGQEIHLRFKPHYSRLGERKSV